MTQTNREQESSPVRTAATRLKLDWCSHEAAKYACKAWHYSGRLPKNKKVRIGIWEDGVFSGAIVYSRGGNPHLPTMFGLDVEQVCELTRIAMKKGHAVPVSKIISISLSMIRRVAKKLRIIVAYADEGQNHLGVVYQAANWIYTGKVRGIASFVKADGTPVHGRNVVFSDSDKRLAFGPCLRKSECFKKRPTKKHRYIWVFDKQEREYWRAKLGEPYPKRSAPQA